MLLLFLLTFAAQTTRATDHLTDWLTVSSSGTATGYFTYSNHFYKVEWSGINTSQTQSVALDYRVNDDRLWAQPNYTNQVITLYANESNSILWQTSHITSLTPGQSSDGYTSYENLATGATNMSSKKVCTITCIAANPPTWNWSSDFSSCTATFTCAESPSLTATVNATVTTSGSTATATVSFNGTEYSDTKTTTFAINYVLNGGTNSTNNPSTYNVSTGVASFANPTRTNYNFAGWYRASDFSGSQVTSIAAGTSGEITLYAKWTPDPTHFSQSGNTYTIKDAAGWEVFCDLLANNTKGYFTDKIVELGADITISRAAGSDKLDFTGEFDGQGNTITLKFGTADKRWTEHAAVFRNVEWADATHYAKIKNLNVNGEIYTASNVIYDAGLVAKAYGGLEITNCTSSVTIHTSNQYAGGFVGLCDASLNIVNCVSAVTIYSSVENNTGAGNDGTHGGFVGTKTNNANYAINIEGSVFCGSLFSDNGTTACGGFIGYRNNNVTITNCLYAPTDVTIKEDNSATFARNGATITNSYYTRAFGTPQGKQAHTITAGDNVIVDFSGTPTVYNVSGITAYTNGIKYNNTLYAGSEDIVALDLSHADLTNYKFDSYKTSGGTLDGNTLTMPGKDVTISGNYSLHPTYLDADGNVQYCTNYTALTGSETTLSAGWYVAFGNISYDHTITISNDVHLILTDGCRINIGTADTRINGKGISKNNYEDLTIYGQSRGDNEGILSVYTEGKYNHCIFAGELTINGGHVIANTNGEQASALYAANSGVVINNGTVEAIAAGSGNLVYAIRTFGNFTYNGGILTTTTDYGNAIYAGDGCTFSWRCLDDRITIGNTGISVRDGYHATFTRLFTDNDGNYYYGIYTRDQLAVFAGKTLIPAESVTIDGNSDKPVSITNKIENVNVVFNRDFTQGVNSTLILPFGFTLTDDFKANYGNFYSLQTIRYNEEYNQWEGWLENPVSDEVAANTPYVFVPSKTFSSMTFTGVTIQPTTPNDQSFGENIDDDNTEWTFKGTYTQIEFADFVNQEKPIYGFAGTAKNNISVGEFVRAHDRVSIKPLRCYLEYNGKDKALTKSAVELPDNIVLRIISSATDPDESTDNPDSDITTPTSELAPTANAKVWSYDHTIYISAQPGTTYRIIDALGRVLKDGITATDRDEVRLGTRGGIAVVVIKNKTFKVSY